MKRYYPLLALALLIACQEYRDEVFIDDSTGKDAEASFFPLQVGNAWVYGRYTVQDAGRETMLDIEEESITKDTSINGRLYYKVEGTEFGNPFVRFVRDSSGYYVDHRKRIWLAPGHFDEILARDTFYDARNNLLITFFSQMRKVTEKVIVPAGDFDVLDFEETVAEPARSVLPEPKFNHNYYARGVGRVKHGRNFIFSNRRLERRLLRYDVG